VPTAQGQSVLDEDDGESAWHEEEVEEAASEAQSIKVDASGLLLLNKDHGFTFEQVAQQQTDIASRKAMPYRIRAVPANMESAGGPYCIIRRVPQVGDYVVGVYKGQTGTTGRLLNTPNVLIDGPPSLYPLRLTVITPQAALQAGVDHIPDLLPPEAVSAAAPPPVPAPPPAGKKPSTGTPKRKQVSFAAAQSTATTPGGRKPRGTKRSITSSDTPGRHKDVAVEDGRRGRVKHSEDGGRSGKSKRACT
jgi:hypothetical protein